MPEYFKNHPIYYDPAKTYGEGMPSGSFYHNCRKNGCGCRWIPSEWREVWLCSSPMKQRCNQCLCKIRRFLSRFYWWSCCNFGKENILSVEVVDFPELGMEAVRKIEVKDFLRLSLQMIRAMISLQLWRIKNITIKKRERNFALFLYSQIFWNYKNKFKLDLSDFSKNVATPPVCTTSNSSVSHHYITRHLSKYKFYSVFLCIFHHLF